jgi:hypothetical protein
MNTSELQGSTPALVDQPAPVRRKNAWWRQLKINRAVRRYPYVISEGEIWFGRKTPNQRAFVWIAADELVGQVAANDEVVGNAK